MSDPDQESLDPIDLRDPSPIELPGPWPATHVESTASRSIRLDVDKFRDLALVVRVVVMPSRGLDSVHTTWRMVHGSVFRRSANGWHCVGGSVGGSGSDALSRRYEPATWDNPLHLRLDVPEALRAFAEWGGDSFRNGTSGMVLVPGIGRVHHSEVLCAPHIATVVVEREDETRTASVISGPGWIGVVWPDDIHPILRAYDESGRERTVAKLGELTGDKIDEVFRQLRGDDDANTAAQVVFRAVANRERDGGFDPDGSEHEPEAPR